MAVISNREAYLASEPEMDITQFHKTALDLKYADESENQILDIFYPEDGEGPISTGNRIPWWCFCGGAQENTLYQINVSAYNTGIRSCNSRVQTLPRRKTGLAQLIDGKAAIRYLRANAKELNLDPDRFAVWGNSARRELLHSFLQ